MFGEDVAQLVESDAQGWVLKELKYRDPLRNRS